MDSLKGQMDLFEFISKSSDYDKKDEVVGEVSELLRVGEYIYRVTLGEIDKLIVDSSFVINSFDNSSEFRGYHLTECNKSGCHAVAHDKNIGVDVFKEFDQAERCAENVVKKCKTIMLNGITEYRKWEHIRECDNYHMTAEIGVVEDCVYVKDWYLYRFAYLFTTEKEKENLIKEHTEKITNSFNAQNINYNEVEVIESPDLGIRLYWSNAGKCYADCTYVKSNQQIEDMEV